MESEKFDYGGDDDSPRYEAGPLSELDALLGTGTSGAEPRQRRQPIAGAGIDMRVAVQVVAAIILSAVAGGLLAHDVWARSARDSAFRQMNDANSRREYSRVLEAAESFLTHPPLNRTSDGRETSVVSLYSEALVHWVAQQPGQLDAKAHARIARYKQLVKTPDK